MPDFSHKAVHQFWHDYKDRSIYRVIAFMEGVEDWTLDGHPDLESAIQKLGTALEEIGNIDLQQEKNLLELLAHIKTGRGLRILMGLDMAYPGAASKVIAEAEKEPKGSNSHPEIFLKRNVVFERLRLLSRVFAADRFKLITKALEESGYD